MEENDDEGMLQGKRDEQKIAGVRGYQQNMAES